MDRIVTVDEVMKAYRIESKRTIQRWIKRDENPLPTPVSGGKGRGNKLKWLRSQLEAWEVTEYGKGILM